MMYKDRLKELFEFMTVNPDLDVLFLYREYGAEEEYTVAKIWKVYIDEVLIDDERILFMSEDLDELIEYFTTKALEDNFPPEEAEKEAIRRVHELPWKEVIVAYLEPAGIEDN